MIRWLKKAPAPQNRASPDVGRPSAGCLYAYGADSLKKAAQGASAEGQGKGAEVNHQVDTAEVAIAPRRIRMQPLGTLLVALW
ncbi:hypothetical protein CAL13_00385 [Bordetella genomosp. 9]|uniref:Uncharacterized protein n=1 Tax=Bordetella genomosp. 9 TaxID=1416803 RepID=A0A1W6YUS8_9BORD|nr:hypothetical protein CAL13_00385 [Bordetella genomosp. 9]